LIFPIDRLRYVRRARWRFLLVAPQLIHIGLALFYGQLVDMLNALLEASESQGFSGLALKPFAWLFSQIMLLFAYVHAHEEMIFGVINIAYVLAAVYFLETGRRYLTNPRLLTQTRAVVWGLRLGLGLYVVGFFALTFGASWDTARIAPYILMTAVVAGGGFFTYAIIRHQFLNVQMFFRQSLINTFISALLVGGYVLVGVRSEIWLRPFFGDRAEVISYLFILLLLLLFQPISSWVDNFVRSMFMRTRTDYRNIMERFSRQVISVFDPLQLRQTIEETLKTALLVDHVYFVLFDDSVGEYAILRSDDYPRRTVIDREDLMLRGINLLDTPTRFGSLDDYRENSRLADILNELNVRVILPMKDAEHLLGFLALSSKAAGYRYTAEDFNLLGVLSNQMVTALTNARLYADSLERLRLEEEVTMARQIQLDLLPSKPPECKLSVIAASSTPSRTVGGDFYDFISIKNSDRIGICIADASGKGMPAALMVAQIQAILHSEVNNGNPIEMVMRNMNSQVVMSTSSEKYVTLFYAELDQANSTLHYANAGHNHPLLVRPDGTVEHLEVGGPIIGAFPNIEYSSATVQLQENDLLFFFTDGLSEAMNADGVEYGESRIKEFVVSRRAKKPQELIDEILADVRQYDPSSPPQDDTTIVTLKMIKAEQLDNV
jgi:sigma-B regulation protein RsbU (phosphoserine phosphatase)